MRLILGSQSPRRRELLTNAGFTFEIRVSNEPEDYDPLMPLEEVAIYLAEKKAKALLPTLQADEVLLCGDSVVICNGELLGKPDDMAHAKQILQKLSQTTHTVITGVCIIAANRFKSFSVTTQVTFKKLSEAEIDYYLAHGKPLDKAGAYGIQEWIGVVGISHIEGCYYNVMGLPIAHVYDALKEFGITVTPKP